jgi:hypothetical protein
MAAAAADSFYGSMILSDLPSPAEAWTTSVMLYQGFAQAGNRRPPRIKSGAGFFGIMLRREYNA